MTMNIAPDALAVSWGYRRQLVPKSLAYVYSLDFVVVLDVGARWYLRTNMPAPGETLRPEDLGESYHVFGDTAVLVGDGVRRDVPTATVKTVYAELLDASDVDPAGIESNEDVAGLEARILLDAGESGSIVATLNGIVSIDGGTSNLKRSLAFRTPPLLPPRISGTSVVSLTHETGRSHYRWMDHCQLFGVGRVDEKPGSQDGLIRLGFTFDIYFAR